MGRDLSAFSLLSNINKKARNAPREKNLSSSSQVSSRFLGRVPRCLNFEPIVDVSQKVAGSLYNQPAFSNFAGNDDKPMKTTTAEFGDKKIYKNAEPNNIQDHFTEK